MRDERHDERQHTSSVGPTELPHTTVLGKPDVRTYETGYPATAAIGRGGCQQVTKVAVPSALAPAAIIDILQVLNI